MVEREGIEPTPKDFQSSEQSPDIRSFHFYYLVHPVGIEPEKTRN